MNDTRQFDSKNVAGYLSSSIVLNRTVNLILSVVFLILLAPLIIILIPAVFLVNGWPVIYAGTRLGKNKKKFIMYKFRTLPQDFEKQYDGKLVSYQHGYQLPRFCRFMRDTRLDEIPQLINIFKGDMDFVGPRPVRPVIYQTVCRSIQGYDKRFSVKPGLIGYSQLFTPHSTPKRIRSFIDNLATRNPQNFFYHTLIILLAGFGVILKALQLSYRFFMIFLQDKILKKFDNKRALDRIKQKFGTVHFCTLKEQFNYFCLEFESNTGVLKDINEEYFRVDTHLPLNTDKVMFRVEALVDTKLFKKQAKSFYGHATIFKMHENPGKALKYTYILRYEPASDLNRYFVDQYFLKKSLMRYVL